MTLQIGQMLYGYCGGIFGRDSYEDKRVEAVGIDWVVVREDDGIPNFASGFTDLEYLQRDECIKEPKDETS